MNNLEAEQPVLTLPLTRFEARKSISQYEYMNRGNGQFTAWTCNPRRPLSQENRRDLDYSRYLHWFLSNASHVDGHFTIYKCTWILMSQHESS